MKKALVLLFTLLMGTAGFAVNGAMSGSSGNVKVIHLEHFDIIFAEESEASAKKIAGVCEDYYREITDYLAFDPKIFLPVTITRTVEQLNAYFTQVPYNRIVLFDTPPDSSLDMYADTLPQVFYHELTHAITMNMKSPFWQGVSTVFGDVFTPSNINLTTFWDESATVSFESRGEGGRLNDSFATQLVTAAKVKNQFPDWRDVTGARDTYPGGNDAYYFGGMFARYLVDKYGIEKYSAFWQRAGRNPAIFSGSTTFKGTYERSLDEEWKDFEESIYVPAQTEADFEEMTVPVSHPEAYVQSCDIHQNRIVFFDSKSHGVYDQDNKRIFSCIGVECLRFWKDDTLLVHRYVARDNTKYEPFYYEINSSRVVKVENPVKDSHSGLYSRIPLENGDFFAIEKDGLDFYVVYLNKDLAVEKRWSCGDGRKMILHNLHFSRNTEDSWNMTFTWAELGKGSCMVSRTGRISVDKASFTATVNIQKDDFAFGITDYLSDGKNHYAVIQKYEEAPLCRIDLGNVWYQTFTVEAMPGAKNEQLPQNTDSYRFASQDYSPFSYYTDGIFLPASSTGIIRSDFEFDDHATGLGVTYISSNPWGDKVLTLTGAVFSDEAVYGAGASLSGGNDTFAYEASLHGNYYAVDSLGCALATVAFSRTLWTGLVSRTGFAADTKGFIGKNSRHGNDDRKFSAVLDEKAVQNKLSLFWTNTRKSHPFPYYVKGVTFEPFFEWEYRKTENENLTDGKIEKESYANCGASLTIQYPVFVPFTLSGTVFPKRSVFAEGFAKVNLVDIEIQKGIPLLPLYFDRMVLSCIYSGSISCDSSGWFDCKKTASIAENVQWSDFKDNVTAKLSFVSSLNTGYFASASSQFEFYGYYRYRINNAADKDKHSWGVSCAIVY